jgi:hypothetical protein
MNRGELVARAGLIMGMARSSTDSAPEVSVLQQLANEAVLDVLKRTKIHVRRTTLDLTAGVTDYDLSQTVIRLWSLAYEGAEMLEVGEGDLLAYDEGDNRIFQMPGYNMLILGWEPAANEEIEALYTPRPIDMTQDSHDPALVTYGLIPEEWHDALVNYICWKAGEITRDQMSGMGEKFRRMYEGDGDTYERLGTNIGDIRAAVNRRGATGSPLGRTSRMGARSAADRGARTWV